MTLEQIRERAAAAVQRAEEIQARMAAADEHSADDQAAFDAATAEAARLYDEAAQVEQRAAAVEALRQRGSEPESRAGGRSFGSHDENGMPHTDQGNTRGGRHEYSLSRAMLGAVYLRDGSGVFRGLEAETHQELLKRSQGDARGVLIPWDAPVPRSAMYSDARTRDSNDLTTSTGSGAIPTHTLPTLVDFLRSRMVLSALGATFITGMHQAFKMPRQTNDLTAEIVAEQSKATKSKAGVDHILFNPKTITANTRLSRKFLIQSVFNGDAFAGRNLGIAIAQKLQRAVLSGAGGETDIKGILKYTSPVGSVTLGTNGGAMSWAKLNEMIGKVDSADAPDETRAFLFNPLTVAKMASTPRESGHPKYLYDIDMADSPVAGYPAKRTSAMPSNGTKGTGSNLSSAIFAVWSELAIALMSPLDLLADPYTLSEEGDIRFIAHQEADANPLHEQAFCICTDIVTA